MVVWWAAASRCMFCCLAVACGVSAKTHPCHVRRRHLFGVFPVPALEEESITGALTLFRARLMTANICRREPYLFVVLLHYYSARLIDEEAIAV